MDDPSELRPEDHEVSEGGEEQLLVVRGSGHPQDSGYLNPCDEGLILAFLSDKFLLAQS